MVSLLATVVTAQSVQDDVQARPLLGPNLSPIHRIQFPGGTVRNGSTVFDTLTLDYAVEVGGTVYAQTNSLPQAIEVAALSSDAVVVSQSTGTVVWAAPNPVPSQGSPVPNPNSGGGASSGSDGQSSAPSEGSPSPGTPSSGSSTPVVPSVYYSVANGLLFKTLAGGYSYVIGPAPAFMTTGNMYTAKGTQFYHVNGDGTATSVGTYESPYRTLDLTLAAPITADQMTAFIQANDPTSPLLVLVPVYLQAQQTYGVNAVYLLAHSVIESAWGTSQIAHDKNNLFGYSAFDTSPYTSATTFPSMAYAILYEAWFVRTSYLTSSGQFYNGPNLDGMNVDYATDPNWAESIASVMWSMMPYSTSDYASETALPVSSTEPVFSYASGVKGTITASVVNIRSQPSLQSSVYEQLNSGTAVSITGWLPGWYQLVLPDKRMAFVSSKYARPTNLAKVIGSSVQVRLAPRANIAAVHTASYGDLVITLGTSQDGQWTQVILMDGTEGYIFSKYIANLT